MPCLYGASDGCVSHRNKRYRILHAAPVPRFICSLLKNSPQDCFYLRFFAQLEPRHSRLQAPLTARLKVKGHPDGCPVYMVRVTGLEPVRQRHTPLKRACLPIPAHSHIEQSNYSILFLKCQYQILKKSENNQIKRISINGYCLLTVKRVNNLSKKCQYFYCYFITNMI